MADKCKIKQIIGCVVDVEFSFGNLPKTLDRLECKVSGRAITLEVAQHLDKKSVRTIASAVTDDLVNGMTVFNLPAPSAVKLVQNNIEHTTEILLNNSSNIKKPKLPQLPPKADHKLHRPKHEYRPYTKLGPCHANNYR